MAPPAVKQSAPAHVETRTSLVEAPASRPGRTELKTGAPEVRMIGSGGMMPPEMEANIKKQMEERRIKKLDERVAALKARLNLTDDQAAKLRPLLEGSVDGGGPKIDFTSNGVNLAFGAPEGPKERKAMDDKITALLSEDQQKAYDGFKQEQRENRIELATNSDLMQLQRELTLTPDQKDRAFQALRDVAQKEDDQGIGGNLFDPQLMMEKMEARRNALRPILTPEQMNAYEQSPRGVVFEGGGVFGGVSIPADGAEAPAK